MKVEGSRQLSGVGCYSQSESLFVGMVNKIKVFVSYLKTAEAGWPVVKKEKRVRIQNLYDTPEKIPNE